MYCCCLRISSHSKSMELVRWYYGTLRYNTYCIIYDIIIIIIVVRVTLQPKSVRSETERRFSQDGMTTNNGATGTRWTHVAAATEKYSFSQWTLQQRPLPYQHTHTHIRTSLVYVFSRLCTHMCNICERCRTRVWVGTLYYYYTEEVSPESNRPRI